MLHVWVDLQKPDITWWTSSSYQASLLVLLSTSSENILCGCFPWVRERLGVPRDLAICPRVGEHQYPKMSLAQTLLVPWAIYVDLLVRDSPQQFSVVIIVNLPSLIQRSPTHSLYGMFQWFVPWNFFTPVTYSVPIYCCPLTTCRLNETIYVVNFPPGPSKHGFIKCSLLGFCPQCRL